MSAIDGGIAYPDRARATGSAARLSVISNTVLVLLKLAVGLATGTVSVVAEAAHSANDLVAAVFAFVAVRKAGEPADESHPFGHGKFESLSGFLEALLIFGAAVGIVWASIHRLLAGGEPERLGLGMGVMLVSAVLNTVISRRLLITARRYDSVALEADGWHLLGDVYTSVAVLVGLILVHVLSAPIVDPIAAMVVGLVLLHSAWRLTRASASQLLDRSLDADITRIIASVVDDHNQHFLETHKLRTRKSGGETHVDLHMVVCRWLPTGEAHDLATHIENEIRTKVPRAHVLIHIEGANGECVRAGATGSCPKSEGLPPSEAPPPCVVNGQDDD